MLSIGEYSGTYLFLVPTHPHWRGGVNSKRLQWQRPRSIWRFGMRNLCLGLQLVKLAEGGVVKSVPHAHCRSVHGPAHFIVILNRRLATSTISNRHVKVEHSSYSLRHEVEELTHWTWPRAINPNREQPRKLATARRCRLPRPSRPRLPCAPCEVSSSGLPAL